MKNIHVLPTDKPSSYVTNYMEKIMQWQNIYITSDEEIKEGWSYDRMMRTVNKIDNVYSSKIILTTDPQLIEDGVQAIDDEFLEWFVKNPSCEEVEVNDWLDTNGNIAWGGNKRYQICNHLYDKIIIPKEELKQIKCYCGHTTYCDCSPLDEAPNMDKQVLVKMWESAMPKLEPKQETLEEAGKDFIENEMKYSFKSMSSRTVANRMLKCVEFGAKWQAERMFSEEDLQEAFYAHNQSWIDYERWFEQFKKK
jgi:hypothetical protein